MVQADIITDRIKKRADIQPFFLPPDKGLIQAQFPANFFSEFGFY